jgi:hypothetical protein
MIFNTKGQTADPPGRFGSVKMTTSGFPGTAYIALADDAYPGPVDGETYTLINGTDTWSWGNPYTTDGAVIGGLNGEWVIDIFTQNVANNPDYWYFLDGPDYRNPDWNLLANSPAGVRFQIEATGFAPSPATVLLLTLGLAGIGYMRWTKSSA